MINRLSLKCATGQSKSTTFERVKSKTLKFSNLLSKLHYYDNIDSS
uniref:Uncharacterized protein n=1 Tax=Arundo donax TaxID=35708 RepID=A0A0A9CET5_ARUDO